MILFHVNLLLLLLLFFTFLGRKQSGLTKCTPAFAHVWGLLAYAYLNDHLSVYNDIWFDRVNVQVHEIGHNLNLAHSGQRGDPSVDAYADQSCTMGFGYREDDGPIQCFNGAKSYQLGWFEEYHIEVDPFNVSTGDLLWNGTLIGLADYESFSSSSPAADGMILRIASENMTNAYYVHFNRKVGVNNDTREGGDEIMITERERAVITNSTVSNAQSWLLANLTLGESHRFGDASTGLAFTLDVTELNLSSTPAYASVSIVRKDDYCPYGNPCDAKPIEVGAGPVDFFTVRCNDNERYQEGRSNASYVSWFSFVAPESGCVELDQDFELLGWEPTYMYVYAASSCDSTDFSLVASATNFLLPPYDAVIKRIFVPGRTYYGNWDGGLIDGTLSATACGPRSSVCNETFACSTVFGLVPGYTMFRSRLRCEEKCIPTFLATRFKRRHGYECGYC
mmetsp:Transcript_15794/g.24045  ORF Transcript_15794/g.24045 Transcript_15794/m.24045 type:complete len:451 (+) Transcript_15794:688-2040(+)